MAYSMTNARVFGTAYGILVQISYALRHNSNGQMQLPSETRGLNNYCGLKLHLDLQVVCAGSRRSDETAQSHRSFRCSQMR